MSRRYKITETRTIAVEVLDGEARICEESEEDVAVCIAHDLPDGSWDTLDREVVAL